MDAAEYTRLRLTDEKIARIATTHHTWRGEKGAGDYADVLGFCKSARLAENASHEHVPTLGRYIGAEGVVDDGEPFAKKRAGLTAKLETQFAKSVRVERATQTNLKGLAFRNRGKS